MKRIELDGALILTARNFHDVASAALEFPDYYGKNLDALWDVMSSIGGVTLVWTRAALSRAAMPAEFDLIVGVLREAAALYPSLPVEERFHFILKL